MVPTGTARPRSRPLVVAAHGATPAASRPALLGQLRRRIFGISSAEASFARRGFRPTSPATQQRLEQVGYVFLAGYHAALEEPAPTRLAMRLASIEAEWQGFAFEGAAMALTLMDAFTPWGADRLQRFLAGPGHAHRYMVHVGAGWALARLRRPVAPTLQRLNPVLAWLVVDGYGFHEGYFGWQRYLGGQARLPLGGYAAHVFDQGLGRSLWFVAGADGAVVAEMVQSLPAPRRADLWSGIGLACTYAGGADPASMAALRVLAGPYVAPLAQGAAFAATARLHAGNTAKHTDLACRVLTGLNVVEATRLTEASLLGLPNDWPGHGYETWRQRIQAYFGQARGGHGV